MAIDDIDASDRKLMNQARAAANAKAADEAVARANALANLALSGATTTPSDALRKLTSGQTLTEGERALLNMGPLPRATQNPATGASIAENARLDQIAADAAAAKAAAEEAARNAKNQAELDAANAAKVKAEADAKAARDALAAINSQQNTLAQQILAQQNSAAAEAARAKEANRQSAIAAVTARFKQYGLDSLANKIRDLAIDGATESTITLALQETPEYQLRFSANTERTKKNLSVLSPAEYISLEDSYRQVLRSYGLTQFDNDAYVKQFISNDVSATELSNRVVTAVQRVQNADPAILSQLTDYYGIGRGDLVAYVLDPSQQFQKIQRQVSAAEIGVAAAKQGLQSNVAVSEQLAAQGVTQAEAQKGYATIADILPTATKLSEIYGATLDSYDQSTAEQEVFNQLASAQRKRQRLTAREVASFSGSSGLARGGLSEGKAAGQI